MILVGINADQVPLLEELEKGGEESRVQAEIEERGLVYVAMTRARDKVRIYNYGAPSPFFNPPNP